jgi:hypothetical protein
MVVPDNSVFLVVPFLNALFREWIFSSVKIQDLTSMVRLDDDYVSFERRRFGEPFGVQVSSPLVVLLLFRVSDSFDKDFVFFFSFFGCVHPYV